MESYYMPCKGTVTEARGELTLSGALRHVAEMITPQELYCTTSRSHCALYRIVHPLQRFLLQRADDKYCYRSVMSMLLRNLFFLLYFHSLALVMASAKESSRCLVSLSLSLNLTCGYLILNSEGNFDTDPTSLFHQN